MTNAVPSLKELAAQVVVENNDVNQLQPVLPPELINYLQTLNGEISLELATRFYDRYHEMFQTFAALGGQDADVATIDQLLASYQQLVLMHDQAAQALATAMATAVNSTDPAWRDYTVTLLTDVQEHVTTLGHRVENMIEHLTWLRSAF